MPTVRHILFSLCCVLFIGTTTLAQNTCNDLIALALERTTNNCSSPITNTVCYGNDLITVEAQEGFTLQFDTVGDTEPIVAIRSLQHNPLDEVDQFWGVSLLSLRGNIPDTIPGQVVQIIVFGDVTVEGVEQSAFQLRSGIGSPSCTEAPPDGIMVQTPEGIAEVNLTINNIEVTLGSTAFIEANAENGMTISMLNGIVNATALDETESATFSQQINIPLVEENGILVPSDPPSPAEPWDAEKISKLFDITNTLAMIGTEATPADDTITGSSAPCLISAPDSNVRTRVGPGTARGAFGFLESGKEITVTGKKLVNGELWWQLNKEEVSERATAVLELWVLETAVGESGDCNSVPDVDAPPVIPAAPQATETPADVPQVDTGIPSVNPIIDVAITSTVAPGQCANVTVSVEFVSSAFLSGPGSINDSSIEGPVWSTNVCPPSEPGSYTYSVDAYSLDGSIFAQKFATVTVAVAGT